MSVASRDFKLLLQDESDKIDNLLAVSPISPGKKAIFKKFFESSGDSADEYEAEDEAVEKGYDGDVENEEVEVKERKKSTSRNYVYHRVYTADDFSSESDSACRVVRKRLNSDASSDPDSDSSDGTIDYMPTDGAGEEIVQIVGSE